MVCLVNGFAKGAAGVRPELAEMLVDALNRGLVPTPSGSLGSVGQADLGPMADLAEGLLRRDRLRPRGQRGSCGARQHNAFATGWAALVGARRRTAAGGSRGRRRPRPRGVRGQPQHSPSGGHRGPAAPGHCRGDHAACARCSPGAPSHEPGNARNLQDPLTFRSIPQILGAAGTPSGTPAPRSRPSSTPPGCNPAVVLAERRIVSVGNLDIVPVAAAWTLPASPWPRW
mgnify:CR=1 FL=1